MELCKGVAMGEKNNPNRARRELQEDTKKRTTIHSEALFIMDKYYQHLEMDADQFAEWVAKYFSQAWSNHHKFQMMKQEEEKKQRELEKRQQRKNGLLRLRSQPVGSVDRKYWYETGDGREDKSKLTFHSKYGFTLAAGPKHRKFIY
jgi:16S rRNA C967 or C1407 C5-methylase (RsmB/RsmF family)